MKRIASIIILLIIAVAFATAQVKTQADLKAEQQSLNAEHNSASYKERQNNIALLSAPPSAGIGNVDALADSCKSALALTKINNELLGDLYRRTIDSTGTLLKPAKEELYGLSTNITTVSNDLAKTAKDLLVLQDDEDNADMLKQPNVVQSISYVKTVNALLTEELAYQIRLFNNLMAVYRLSH
jgi:hypothetical protein